MSKEEDDDTALVQNLLTGHFGEFGEVTFPERNSEQEQKALRALARMLYASAHRAADPLDRSLQIMLAELFNPSGHIVRASDDQDYFLGMAAAERKIEFKLRTNRREVPPLRHEVVWAWMQGRVDEGIRVKRVKDLAMQNFELSAETIRRIWLQWGIQKRARRAMAKAGLP